MQNRYYRQWIFVDGEQERSWKYAIVELTLFFKQENVFREVHFSSAQFTRMSWSRRSSFFGSIVVSNVVSPSRHGHSWWKPVPCVHLLGLVNIGQSSMNEHFYPYRTTFCLAVTQLLSVTRQTNKQTNKQTNTKKKQQKQILRRSARLSQRVSWI